MANLKKRILSLIHVFEAPPETHARGDDWFDRTSNWLNPILVKETRQALKSRAFIVSFFLLLLGSWMISVIGLLAAGPAIEYGRTGHYFFIFYFGTLCLAVGAVVPYNAFRSLLSEREENTYDLLSITSLSPGQIVRGKWACSLLQALLFYFAIIPFMAFSSLMPGFDFVQSAVLLIFAFYCSLALSMVMLMLSTTIKQRTWQGVISLLVLSLLGAVIFVTLSGLSGLIISELPLSAPWFWWGIAGFLALTLSYLWLFYQIAVARLTFEAENRATNIRVTALAQILLLILGGAALFVATGRGLSRDHLQLLFLGVAVHTALVGIAVSPEVDGLSRRVRRSLPRWKLSRLLMAPFLPGGSLGFLYTLGFLACIYLSYFAAWLWSDWRSGGPSLGLSDPSFPSYLMSVLFGGYWERVFRPDSDMTMATAIVSYIAIYCGLSACLVRWGRGIYALFSPVHARTMIVILIALGALVPMGLRAGDYVRYEDSVLADTLFPFWYLMEIDQQSATRGQLLLVVAVALFVVALNIPAMARALRDVALPRDAPASIGQFPADRAAAPIPTPPSAPARLEPSNAK